MLYEFSEMLQDPSMAKKDSAVKCLEVLSTSKEEHWKCILDAGKIVYSLLHLAFEFIYGS